MATSMKSTTLQLLSFMALLAIAFLPFISSAHFKRPPGLPDGLYYGALDENGVTKMHFLGHANYTALPQPQRQQRVTALLDNGIHCDRQTFLAADDVKHAVTGLANFFGDGNSFYALSVSSYYGTAVAFGCNFAYGQSYDSTSLLNDETEISDTCGNTVGGLFTHASWKSAYGRCSSSKGFCNF